MCGLYKQICGECVRVGAPLWWRGREREGEREREGGGGGGEGVR